MRIQPRAAKSAGGRSGESEDASGGSRRAAVARECRRSGSQTLSSTTSTSLTQTTTENLFKKTRSRSRSSHRAQRKSVDGVKKKRIKKVVNVETGEECDFYFEYVSCEDGTIKAVKRASRKKGGPGGCDSHSSSGSGDGYNSNSPPDAAASTAKKIDRGNQTNPVKKSKRLLAQRPVFTPFGKGVTPGKDRPLQARVLPFAEGEPDGYVKYTN